VLKMVDKEYIRKKHFVEGWSIRRISRQMGYSRQTVGKCLKDATISRYTLTKPRPAPVIERWLKEDEERPAKAMSKMWCKIPSGVVSDC
jgi:DNA transposition AAA+ family ATPase